MSEVAQLVMCRMGKRFEAHPTTAGLDTYMDLRAEDGTMGALLLWKAGNSNKAAVKMGDYEDRQRGVMRRVATNRKYDIPQPASALKEAKAVVVVNGVLVEASSTPNLAADELGAAATIMLRSRERGQESVFGGVFFFADETSADAFLASDAWTKAKADACWSDIVVERYEAVSGVVAPSA